MGSTDCISVKGYLIDILSLLSVITLTSGRKFIDGYYRQLFSFQGCYFLREGLHGVQQHWNKLYIVY